ncbi:hypothetical protein [Candidatus Hodgkinia cicadicola]|uniref:hypothetical protein n=1 Tax=Candidatus Hodgkinia cicadicola TaxID=573658 RepID=UPI001788AF0E
MMGLRRMLWWVIRDGCQWREGGCWGIKGNGRIGVKHRWWSLVYGGLWVMVLIKQGMVNIGLIKDNTEVGMVVGVKFNLLERWLLSDFEHVGWFGPQLQMSDVVVLIRFVLSL